MRKQLLVLMFVIILTASLALGSGFSIYEHGAKATAMGGAFIAQANDATAIFYNPAGITSLNGFNLGLGATVIMPQAYFLGPTDIDKNLYSPAKNETFVMPALYATYQITDKLAAGFGFFVPFGLGSDWGTDWVGRELATNSDVQVLAINPTIAYKVLDNLSIAAGFEYAFADVVIEKSVYLGYALDKYAEFKLKGSTTGMSFNLGLQYKPMPKLTLGAMYRHNMTLDFTDGKASFKLPQATAGVESYLQQNLPNTGGSAKITLPLSYGLGIAYDLTEKLTAEVDYVQENWSSYDKLVIKFDEPVNGESEQTAIKNYENSASYRLGFEYRVTDQFAARLGYLRDLHSVPDQYVEPDLPEGDRNIYNVGVGYKIGGLSIDAYYMLLLQEDRTITNSDPEEINFNGTYKSKADLFGVTFGYSF
jgi:long-chain fatty acid transport protein